MAIPANQRIKDFDIYDTSLPGGKPNVLYDDEAISNMLIFWITSSNGDYIRQPSTGGVFQDLLFKPLVALSRGDINYYSNLVQQSFGNVLTIQNFTIEPDTETYSWYIKLEWISNLTNQVNETQLSIVNRTTPTQMKTSYIEIPFVGENLYNLVLLKLPDLNKSKLFFSATENAWIWANLKLINLVDTDPYFSSILLAING